MAVATYEDVAVALGRPISIPAEQAQVTYWLNGIELLIKSRLGPIPELDQDVLKFVETEAVAAKVRSTPSGGASSVSVSADDGTVTRRWENSTVGEGDISDSWWDMLDPTRGASGWSTRPGFEPDVPDYSLDWT